MGLSCSYLIGRALGQTPTSNLTPGGGGGGTLGISGWGCAVGTLEPLPYTKASSAEFCYPILELTPQITSILE